MNKGEEVLLEKLAIILYEEELKKIKEKAPVEKDLDGEQIKILAEKIEKLPYSYQTILKSKFFYKDSPEDITQIFAIENPRKDFLFIRKTLSSSIGLNKEIISDKSFEKACEILVEKEIKELEEIKKEKINFKPSNDFKKKMRKLGINIDPPYIRILKKVAIFFLIVTSSLTLFFSINVEAREKLFDWIIKDFGEYSTFTPEKINTDYEEKVNISDLKINYIPEGFDLEEIQEGRNIRIYSFNNKNKNIYFILKLKNITEGNNFNAFDTENSTIESININGNDGYIWTHTTHKLLWQQNGIECFISGNIDKTELIKIAENISK